MALRDHLERRAMTPTPRLSVTNIISLAGIIATIVITVGGAGIILYSKVEAESKAQQEINQNFKASDERLSAEQARLTAREEALDSKMSEMLASQARVEGALGINTQMRRANRSHP